MTSGASPRFGVKDASFQAAGGVEGIRQLVDDFYRIMDESAEASGIRRLHPSNLTTSRDKLARFLCGWLGGPRLYSAKYGPISIPEVHAHLNIGEAERDAWLSCMEKAAALQSYSSEFTAYLLAQLRVPAQRVLLSCRQARGNHEG
jgi:hemoglobin